MKPLSRIDRLIPLLLAMAGCGAPVGAPASDSSAGGAATTASSSSGADGGGGSIEPATVTVTLDGDGDGEVVSSPQAIDCGTTCTAAFEPGAVVALLPAPGLGSIFVGWSGACQGEAACIVTVDGPVAVAATFSRSSHDLDVVKSGDGKGVVSTDLPGIDCGPACAASYETGTTLTLTATPDSASSFVGWSGACSGTAPCELTMDTDHGVTAQLLSKGGDFTWVRTAGSTSSEEGRGVAVDLQGNVVIIGGTNGTLDFGGGPVSATGVGDNTFVAKYSAGGTYLWAKLFHSDGVDSQFGLDVGVDAAGDVFITGPFYGTTDFGGGPLVSAGESDVFVVKLDGATGAHLWSRRIGGAGFDATWGAAVDSAGAFIVSGYVTESVDFGGSVIEAGSAGTPFLAKYSGADGSYLWARVLTPGFGFAYEVASDPANNVLVAGSFVGSIDFGEGPIPSHGPNDDEAFVAKYTPDGTLVWSNVFGGLMTDIAYSVAADSGGDVFVAGTFKGTVQVGPDLWASSGVNDVDIFLMKLSGQDGSYLWSRAMGNPGGDEIWPGVAVDAKGNVAITGTFWDTVDFGGGPLVADKSLFDPEEGFVAKYEGAEGGHLWSRRFGGASSEWPFRIAADPTTGHWLVVGKYFDTADFGGGPVPCGDQGNGAGDMFLLHLSP